MKRLIQSLFSSTLSKVKHFLWHCLWVMVLSLSFMGSAAAANVNLGSPCPANPLHTLGDPGLTVGTPLSDGAEDIFAIGGGSQVVWQRTLTPPSGCTASDGERTIDCNGVTVMTPGDLVNGSTTEFLAAGGDPVDVAVNPTAAGGFTFEFTATNVDGPESCSRKFYIDINEPPQPFDLVFVLDRSGSMGEDIDPSSPGFTFWDALKESVNSFTPLIQSTAPEDSQFGLTLFSDVVLTLDDSSDPDDFPDTLITIDDDLATDVENELSSQTPGGGTAMGVGLKDGIVKPSDTPTVPSRPRVLVLFTDGIQNVEPLVNLEGDGFSDGSPIIDPSDPAAPDSIKIITVGTGLVENYAEYFTVLQALAAENHGSFLITSTGSSFEGNCTGEIGKPSFDCAFTGDIGQTFDFAIADALSSSSPLIVDSYSGTLDAEGPASVRLQAFDINANLKRLVISFSFSRDFEVPEMEDLLAGIRIDKDGEDVTAFFEPIIVGSAPNSVTLTTDFVQQVEPTAAENNVERLASEGSYTIELPKLDNEDLSYRVIPYADDARLDMEWQVTPTLPRVDQPFNPTVKLTWRGQPIKEAVVDAFVLQPGDDLGDLSARTEVEELDPSLPGSPGFKKILQLQQNPDFLEKLAFQGNRLSLVDQGDGTYTAAFDPGNISGIYQVFYLINAKDPELGSPIQRFAAQSAYVRFGDIDLSTSQIDSSFVDQDNTGEISWQPVTTDGRFVGPANCSAIQLSGPTITSCVDNLDGSYTISLQDVTPDSEIAVNVLDDEVFRGLAKQFSFNPDLHTVEALNDAYGDGFFANDEIGEPGGQVLFQVTITNGGPNDITINAIEDSLFGPQLANLVGTTIAAGESVTGTFSGTLFESSISVLEGTEGSETLMGAEALQTNTVSVSFTDTNGSTATVSDDSTVRIPAKDTIAGGLGDDRIFGNGADDILRGDLNQRNPQVGTGGNDFISGGTGDDRIGGKGGDDTLLGDEGDDQIYGDDGDDILLGGPGNDTLTGDDSSGGKGSDIFVLAAGDDTDTITDFEVGTDFIGLMDDLTFDQLSIDQTGSDTTISLLGTPRLVLKRVKANDLNQNAFLPNFSVNS